MTVTFDTIRLFELLKPKLGFEESKAIVESLESIPMVAQQAVEQQLATIKDQFASKEDINRLELQISRLEVRMQEKFNSQLIWLVSTIFAATGLAIALIKLT